MNTLKKTFVKIDYLAHTPTQSMFSDGRVLNGDGETTIFKLLSDVFVELGEKTGDNLCQEHTMFQFLLDQYFFDERLDIFLKNNGFLLFNTFYNIDDLKYFIGIKKDFLLDIKSGVINIAILFNGLVPVGVVLAKRIEDPSKILDNIDKLRESFSKKIGEIPVLKDIVL